MNKKNKEKIKTISEVIGIEEILCSLSEEATELAQSALKLRRACTQNNPTPLSVKECLNNLIEEIADVEVCIDTLLLSEFIKDSDKYKDIDTLLLSNFIKSNKNQILKDIKNIKRNKIKRWHERITNNIQK